MIPQLLFDEKIVVVPEVRMVRDTQISKSLDTEIIAFIDDLSSVASKGLNDSDCGKLLHVGSTSGSMHQQRTLGQVGKEERQKTKMEGREGKEKGVKEEEDKIEEVDKNVTGGTVVTRSKKHRKRTVQIFVKVDGGKTSAMEMEMSDKVDDNVKKIPNSDQDVYVTSGGRILRRSD